jgi:DNA-binding CsgD family transcriptional regulator
MSANLRAYDEALAELGHDILSCGTYDKIASRILSPVTRFLGANTSVMFEVIKQGDAVHIGQFASFELENAHLGEYESRFIGFDPVYQLGIQRREAEQAARKLALIRLSEVTNEREFQQTEFYNEFKKPLRIRDQLSLVIRPTESIPRTFVFCFHRASGHKPFVDADSKRLSPLGPYLYACVNALMLQDQLSSHHEVVDALARASPDVGVIVLDARSELRYCNARGQQYLHGDSGSLHDAFARMCRRIGNSAEQVSETLATLAGSQHFGDGMVSAQVLETASGSRNFLITIRSFAMDAALRSRSNAFGWTPRELEVVRLIIEGSTTLQIAHRLSISEHTVDNHLRMIFRKARVHSRTQLIHHLLRESA